MCPNPSKFDKSAIPGHQADWTQLGLSSSVRGLVKATFIHSTKGRIGSMVFPF